MKPKSSTHGQFIQRLCLPALLAFALASMPQLSVAQSDTSYSKLRGMQSESRIPNEYIVVLKQDIVSETMSGGASSSAKDAVQSKAQELSQRFGGDVLNIYAHALTGYALKNIDESQLKLLSNDPAVAYIQANQVFRANITQYTNYWGIDRIDQTDLPLNTSYTYEKDGSGVNAYVFDTGIRRTHASFSGRVGTGYSSINDGRGTNDCNGHGTHVAGTIGSTTFGVAKNVSLHPVRVLDCFGNGSTTSILAGINWLVSNHTKPAVANLSLGGPADSTVDQAIINLISSGVTVVVAAGNDNQNACNVSPARAPFVLAVGASTRHDRKASFSNYGACIDLFAPGEGITSTWYASDTSIQVLDGTSMAAPHVAGVAAMYLQDHQTANHHTVAAKIRQEVTPYRLSQTGQNSPNRLLNMTFLLSGPTPPPPLQAHLSCYYEGPGDLFSCTANGLQGTPPYQYQWNGATSSNFRNATYKSCPNGNTAFVTVTDAAGTQRTANRNIHCTGLGGGFGGPE